MFVVKYSLVISEKRILLISNLDWGSTVLLKQNQPPIHNSHHPIIISGFQFFHPPHHDGDSKTYLWDQNLVAGLHRAGNTLAILIEATWTDSEDLGLVELLDGGFGEEDARCRLGLGLDALHEHAVEERREGLDGLECGGLRTFRISISGLRCIDEVMRMPLRAR